MANGVATASLPDTLVERPLTLGRATTPDVELGSVVANAVLGLAWAMTDYGHHGMMSPAVRETGASKLAQLAEMQLAHARGDSDFTQQARAAGMRELRRLSAGFPLSAVNIEMGLDILISEVLTLTSRVVEDERAMTN